MNNEIVIKSVYGKVNQIYYIQPCPNPKTGKLPSCVRTVDSNGDMILSEEDIRQMSQGTAHFVPANKVFEIVDGLKFDLDDIVDKAHWESIQYCNWIAKDRFERNDNGELVIDGNARRYGVADLYVERPGEITKARMSKKQLVFKASQFIWEDTEQERLKKCRVLGRNLEMAPTADVLDYLINIAEKEPKKIINLYEGEEWKMQLFILDAVDRGVIRKSEGLYKYGDKMLGGSLEATIITLRDIRYKKLLDSIKKETYPNLLPAQEQLTILNDVTTGIPHFENSKDLDSDEDLEDEPTVTTPKVKNTPKGGLVNKK